MKLKNTTDLSKFKGYDLSSAQCHIANLGKVYTDEYGEPMEVEDVADMLARQKENVQKTDLEDDLER